VGCLGQQWLHVDRFLFSRAGPADPDPATVAEDRGERVDQPAGAWLDLPRSIVSFRYYNRQAVRDNH
jgi:hypothetical protein